MGGKGEEEAIPPSGGDVSSPPLFIINGEANGWVEVCFPRRFETGQSFSMKVSGLCFSSTEMWVDEPRGQLYVIDDGVLIRVHWTGKWRSHRRLTKEISRYRFRRINGRRNGTFRVGGRLFIATAGAARGVAECGRRRAWDNRASWHRKRRGRWEVEGDRGQRGCP